MHVQKHLKIVSSNRLHAFIYVIEKKTICWSSLNIQSWIFYFPRIKFHRVYFWVYFLFTWFIFIFYNVVFNTVRINLWKSDRSLHITTVFWKCEFMVGSEDVGLKEFKTSTYFSKVIEILLIEESTKAFSSKVFFCIKISCK